MDSSCSIIAFDRGGAHILQHRNGSGIANGADVFGEDSLRVMHNGQTASDPVSQRVRVGVGEFTCRTYTLEKVNRDMAFPDRVDAILLERVWEPPQAIKELAAQYHLTKREQQALRGVASGLTSKALAARMNITPSTFRAFLRLIKIKMGVSTRAGIMAKILEKTHS